MREEKTMTVAGGGDGRKPGRRLQHPLVERKSPIKRISSREKKDQERAPDFLRKNLARRGNN